MKKYKYSIEQVNFTVGDFFGNFEKIKLRYKSAERKGVSLAIFSELAISGYPIQDLAFNKSFIEESQRYLDLIADMTKSSDCAILVGGLYHKNQTLYNAAFFVEKGKIVKTIIKNNLPNYGVFDEKRIFSKFQNKSRIINHNGISLGVLICEDGWDHNKIDGLEGKELDLIISLNASPFSISKQEQREKVCRDIVHKYNVPSIYVNQVGGQDSLVFDGSSFVCSSTGEVIAQAKSFCEDSVVVDIPVSKKSIFKFSQEEQMYSAMVLGVKDYVHKNGKEKVILGISGGIDSALTAIIAADALGANNVMGVMLKSEYTTIESIKDSELITQNLGIEYMSLSIENVVNTIIDNIGIDFIKDTTEQNIQSRSRAIMLMALSNDLDMLLLNTGNKSENSVGYTTLYGDSCGSYAPLKDIYKTQVFNLSKWRNDNIPEISVYKEKHIIPESIINKSPSAELKHDQKDEDDLPPYEILDKILYCLIEKKMSEKEILQEGFDKVIVEMVIDLLYKSEFKRQQSVLGPKISDEALNLDRRYPITNKFFNNTKKA